MLFSVDKCKVMHIGYNNCCAEYDMGGNKLETVTEEKYLGVKVRTYKAFRRCTASGYKIGIWYEIVVLCRQA